MLLFECSCGMLEITTSPQKPIWFETPFGCSGILKPTWFRRVERYLMMLLEVAAGVQESLGLNPNTALLRTFRELSRWDCHFRLRNVHKSPGTFFWLENSTSWFCFASQNLYLSKYPQNQRFFGRPAPTEWWLRAPNLGVSVRLQSDGGSQSSSPVPWFLTLG